MTLDPCPVCNGPCQQPAKTAAYDLLDDADQSAETQFARSDYLRWLYIHQTNLPGRRVGNGYISESGKQYVFLWLGSGYPPTEHKINGRTYIGAHHTDAPVIFVAYLQGPPDHPI